MKRILYQNDALLTVYHVEKGSIRELHCLQAADETDLNIFIDYLASDQKTPVFWLIDVAVEEYQQVWQPHVLGQERKALLKYRLRRLFEPNTYTHTVFQGRATEGRGDDKFLFLALANAEELLEPWLGAIRNSGVLLQAIYSLPLLSQSLLQHLPKNTYTLLVSQALQAPFSQTESVRQSFFLNGQLQFSRLTPLTVNNPDKYAEYLITQITRTERYLSTTRTMISGQGLNVLILSSSPYFDYLAAHLENYNNDNLPIQLIDTTEFSEYLGISLQHSPQELNLHHLLMHLLAKRPPKNHYGRKPERRYYHHQQITYGLYGLGFGFVILGLLLGSKLFYDNAAIVDKINKIEQDKFIIDNEMAQKGAQTINLNNFDLLAIKPVTQAGTALKQQHYWPNLPLRRISQIFSNPLYTNFILQKITWQVTNAKATTTVQTANEGNLTENIVTLDPTQAVIEHINLKGTIYLAMNASTYIDTLRRFNTLQNELQTYGGIHWKVNVLELPMNENTNDFSTFELEIIIEHHHESDQA